MPGLAKNDYSIICDKFEKNLFAKPSSIMHASNYNNDFPASKKQQFLKPLFLKPCLKPAIGPAAVFHRPGLSVKDMTDPSPHAPILSLTMMTIPKTPGIDFPNEMADEIAPADPTRLPIAVAAASASGQDRDTTQTASAFPLLSEWPMVPEEVQSAIGRSAGSMRIPTFMLNGESPA
jgi:hypothetical protein